MSISKLFVQKGNVITQLVVELAYSDVAVWQFVLEAPTMYLVIVSNKKHFQTNLFGP